MNQRFVKLLAGCAVLSIIFLTIYATVQYSLRSGANDPQILIAEETLKQLKGGIKPEQLVGTPIDISTSLAPFTIVYDKDGKVVASSAQLFGNTPPLPDGVLKHATPEEQNQLTWQPADKVRVAAVIATDGNNYVLSGRSLREIEKREDFVFKAAALAWVLSLLVVLVASNIDKLPGLPKSPKSKT